MPSSPWARRRHHGASLLPSGQSLDLFVTVTDYHGYQPAGADPRSAAGARARAPPRAAFHLPAHADRRSRKRFRPRQCAGARLRGARHVLVPGRVSAGAHRRDRRARRRAARCLAAARRFHRTQFRRATRGPSVDPATCSFIDGAVLNNRPFREAIGAIHGRPAYRQVDRRLVYIDPDPAPPAAASHRRDPGLLRHIAGRDVRYSARPAGHRRAELGHRVQRAGAPRSRPSSRARGRRSAGLVTRRGRDAARPADRSEDRSATWREQVNARGRRTMPASPTRAMCGSSSPRCARSSPS